VNPPLLPDDVLALLACPQDHQPLQRAPEALVTLLNQEIARKCLRDATGSLVQDQMDAGLLHADGLRLYPVVAGLPVLRPEAAIVLTEAEQLLG